MKKDRNSFFSEYNMSSYNNMQPMMPNMYPNQVSSQSSFYSGPAMDYNMNQNYNNMIPQNNMNNNYTSDIESRISKIERQINRIETRLNKLESELSTNYNTTKDLDNSLYNNNNNMYMV
ncbi:MAG: hypothetical protein IJD92_01895 [Bacilli bacterium]|nr:hypothetical protein [Bacilli bacterium]